jgi:hypothetical protein
MRTLDTFISANRATPRGMSVRVAGLDPES